MHRYKIQDEDHNKLDLFLQNTHAILLFFLLLLRIPGFDITGHFRSESYAFLYTHMSHFLLLISLIILKEQVFFAFGLVRVKNLICLMAPPLWAG